MLRDFDSYHLFHNQSPDLPDKHSWRAIKKTLRRYSSIFGPVFILALAACAPQSEPIAAIPASSDHLNRPTITVSATANLLRTKTPIPIRTPTTIATPTPIPVELLLEKTAQAARADNKTSTFISKDRWTNEVYESIKKRVILLTFPLIDNGFPVARTGFIGKINDPRYVALFTATHGQMVNHPKELSIWQPGLSNNELKLHPKYTITSKNPKEDVTLFIFDRNEIPQQFAYLRDGLPMDPHIPKTDTSCIFMGYPGDMFLNFTILNLDKALTQADVLKVNNIRQESDRVFVISGMTGGGASGGILGCDGGLLASTSVGNPSIDVRIVGLLSRSSIVAPNGRADSAEVYFSLFNPEDLYTQIPGYKSK